MKIPKNLFFVLPVLLMLVGCTEVYRYTKESFFAMNTVVDVIRNEQIKEDYTMKTVNEIEGIMSRTLADSEIYRINNGEDVVLSDETLYVLEKSLEIAKATDYAFNPCMGTLTDVWDITSGRNYVPTEDEINNALGFCDASLVTIEDGRVIKPEGMKIDLGGVAKGYALERACETMEETAMGYAVSSDFCISLGGNIGVDGSSQTMKKDGKKGWNVGIANPFSGENTIGSFVMKSGCIAVSGAYERFFEKDGVIYHHIFDSSTGYPAESGLVSAAVICDDGLIGDALSTALFVMGWDRAVEFYRQGKYDFEMILVSKDGHVGVSEGIYDAFSLKTDAAVGVKLELSKIEK